MDGKIMPRSIKKLYGSIFAAIVLILLLPTAALGHVVNEQTIYEDIELSTVKEQIVLLSGLGVIPYEHGTALFKPQEKLKRMELAYWAGAFKRLPSSSSADIAANTAIDIASAALSEGIISSLQGNATYNDVNQAFFQGQAKPVDTVGQLDGELSREAFVQYMTPFLNQKVNGKNLYEMAGFINGPTGIIEEVTQQEMAGIDGKSTKAYILQIIGKKFALGAHPKIVYAPVDPGEWTGRNIVSSWKLQAAGAEGELQLIIFDKTKVVSGSNKTAASTSDTFHSGYGAGDGHTQVTAEAASFPYVQVIVMVLFVLIALWLFARKKRMN
jgi:hypothetical protein